MKRGYHYINGKRQRQIDNSGMDWKYFWNFDLPKKVKVFSWRCIKGTLPVKACLLIKQVNMDGHCPICGKHLETTEHLFLQCSKLSQVCDRFDHKNCCNFTGRMITWFA